MGGVQQGGAGNVHKVRMPWRGKIFRAHLLEGSIGVIDGRLCRSHVVLERGQSLRGKYPAVRYVEEVAPGPGICLLGLLDGPETRDDPLGQPAASAVVGGNAVKFGKPGGRRRSCLGKAGSE